MSQYRLLAGVHVMEDESAEPDDTGRKPSKTYKAGQVVESETDLVAKFGSEKFELVGTQSSKKGAKGSSGTGNPTPGDPPADVVAHAPSTAPHGQVSTGLPQAVPGTEGRPDAPPFQTGVDAESEQHPINKEVDASNEQEDDENLESQHVPELKKLAAEEEVDISGMRTKDEIVKAIRSSRKKSK